MGRLCTSTSSIASPLRFGPRSIFGEGGHFTKRCRHNTFSNVVQQTSNRLTKITDPLSNQTQFEYNLRSQLTKVKDALNQEYVFTYDPLGRTLSQTRAGTTMSYEYDEVGNRTKRTDHSGRVTNYQYDNLNRLDTLLHGTITESTYTYDDLSRLLTATNGAGTVTFTYNNRGLLESETDVFGRLLEYGYDANGNRTSLELDGNTHTTYAYDVANRLTTLTDDASQSYTYGYDIADRLISKALPNGITTTYDYDGMSRLMRLKDATLGSTLLDRQYSYNTASQISAITEPSRTRTFGYDNINRLTSATDSLLGGEAYAFDAVGNRTSSPWSSTYTHQPFNRLTATQTASYGHDLNGNTTSKVEGSTSWTYTWDRENRLTNAASGSASVDYVYDALGRRVKRIDGSDTSEFTHDGEDVVLDDSTVSGTAKYQNGPGIDNKLSAKTVSNTGYFLADHLGSTDALTDATGSVVASNSYDSFGNPTNGSFPTRYQFTGREMDPTIGLHYYRARFYDSKLGRFASEDPIGFSGGDVNLYGYVWNRPQEFLDPSGLSVIIKLLREVRKRGLPYFIDSGKRLSTKQAQNIRKQGGNIEVDGRGSRKLAERIEDGAHPDADLLNHGPHGEHEMYLPHYQTKGKEGHTFYRGGAALLAPNIIGLSDNPCTTGMQMGSAIVWDAAGLLDPIGMTDSIDAYTGLDGGRGGFSGMADYGIDITSPLLPPLGLIKNLY